MLLERKKLLELAKSGKYVFHGSGEDLKILEPRQAHSHKNGVSEKDEKPAVFASPSVDYAILMAIINQKNCPNGYHARAEPISGKEPGTYSLKFSASKKSLDQLTSESFGYVYVLEKSDFIHRRAGEYMIHNSVQPIERVIVKKEDLDGVVEVFG
jgi:hypothetical protein